MTILRTFRENGFIALFAGGCVRDMLMGRKPGDYDIVTNASPEQVMRLFRRTIPVGLQFGIVLVVLKGKKFEVSQFRNTTEPANQLREDAAHRDFTINGMFYDPFNEQVFDYVGGQDDVDRKIIRAIGKPQERFLEDMLRMIRAVRFAVSFDYEIETETLAAIRQFAHKIRDVSVERIREELLKILTSPHPDQGIRLLDQLALLECILPEVTAMKGVQQPEEFHPEGDVFTHTRLMLKHMSRLPFGGGRRRVTPEFAMGVLLHDIGKPGTYTKTDQIHFNGHARVGAGIAEEVCSGFKFSTKSIEHIVTLVRDHLKFFDVEQMKTSTLKRFMRQEYFVDLLELHRLDCLSSNGDLKYYEFCRNKLEAFKQEPMQLPCLISGKDLIALGFTPGPVFKQVLDYIEDAQLEGTVSTKVQALELVKDIHETLSRSESLL